MNKNRARNFGCCLNNKLFKNFADLADFNHHIVN